MTCEGHDPRGEGGSERGLTIDEQGILLSRVRSDLMHSRRAILAILTDGATRMGGDARTDGAAQSLAAKLSAMSDAEFAAILGAGERRIEEECTD